MRLRHEPRSAYCTVRGLRLHYLEWGDRAAPCLLLLHGFASNAHAFDHVADRLCDRYRVLALDQRGHGDSDWAPDGYTPDLYVADLAGLVETLALRAFTLLGHSMGGLHAIRYAARWPAPVARLVIVDIGPELPRTPPATRPELQAPPEEFDSVEEVYAFMRGLDPVPPDDVLRLRARHAVKQLATGKWTWKYDPALRSPRPAGGAGTAGALWATLASIQCPTLVLRGERSDVLARDTAERMARVLRRGRLVEVPGAGHRVPLDNADGFLAALEAFLAELVVA